LEAINVGIPMPARAWLYLELPLNTKALNMGDEITRFPASQIHHLEPAPPLKAFSKLQNNEL
jgi:hypothetical protein